jgi:hypothetical protein
VPVRVRVREPPDVEGDQVCSHAITVTTDAATGRQSAAAQ